MFELIVTIIACTIGIVLTSMTLHSVVKGYKQQDAEKKENKQADETKEDNK